MKWYAILKIFLPGRTRALFLNARASAEIAPETAGIMAQKMGYDQKWEE